jgi:hypothetical protein
VIKDNLIPTMGNLLEPTKVWQVLKNLFKSHNAAQTLYLTNKLHSMGMEEETWVNNFMHTVKETTTNPASARKTIDDIKMVAIVMNVFCEAMNHSSNQ